jgi:hypothetical protein
MKNTTISISDVQKHDNPVIDNLLAFKILTLLTIPFEEMDAFKLGIINNHGDVIKPYSLLTTAKEKVAANYLMRLIITIKRLMFKTPNGEWYLKDMSRALFLIKESYYSCDDSLLIENFLMNTKMDLLIEDKFIQEFNNVRATIYMQ